MKTNNFLYFGVQVGLISSLILTIIYNWTNDHIDDYNLTQSEINLEMLSGTHRTIDGYAANYTKQLAPIKMIKKQKCEQK